MKPSEKKADNFILIADEDFRNIGREILPKCARNFNLIKISPKLPEILSKIAEMSK